MTLLDLLLSVVLTVLVVNLIGAGLACWILAAHILGGIVGR